MSRKKPQILARDHPDVRLIEAVGDVKITEIRAAEGEPAKLPTFTMEAHTFRPIEVGGWYSPVIVEESGMKLRSRIPIRFNHDPDRGVGHTEAIAIVDGKLFASGVISRQTAEAAEVIASAKNGFPWQASIGASVDEFEYIKEGQKATVNGKEYPGPLVVARKTNLREISFVDLGADDRTKAKVAAKSKDLGGDDDERSGDKGSDPDGREEIRRTIQNAARERERHAGIRAKVEEALSFRGADFAEINRISEEALDNNWSVRDTELAILRATRATPTSPRRSDVPKPIVLEAALALSMGCSDEAMSKDRNYGPEVMNQAWQLRNHGLRGILASSIEATGQRVPHGSVEFFDALLRSQRSIQANSGFSTIDIPGILGGAANRFLLEAFTAVQTTYDVVADLADFNNFLTHTVYRMSMLGEFEKVPATGEIPHGRVGEGAFTNKVDTYGKMLTISRQDIINDDLNAFRSLTRQLARKARVAVEQALYEQVMESVDSFYTAARGNKLTGALGLTELAAAEAALLTMTDDDGVPLYTQPARLLVPPALKYLADQYYDSPGLNETTTANKARGSSNVFRGRFPVVSSPFLQSAAFDGASATTWYLLANPNDLAAFQVAFLQGRRSPTVDTSDSEFNTLGISMRCYWDFGVAQLDYRGIIKNVAA